MSHPGMGVMIGMLGGNEETVDAFKAAVGKEIASLEMKDDELHVGFTDGTAIRIYDDGQSCCESRYMRTDADLSYFVGGTLTGAEVRPAPSIEGEYGEFHEIQFLDVGTSKGVFQMATHNEHNGYYGGFWLVVRRVGS